MAIDRIPPERWSEVLRRFSLQHRGWLATLLVTPGDGAAQVKARDLALDEVTAREGGVSIALGLEWPERIMHTVDVPRSLAIRRRSDGAEEALIIERAGGPTTELVFRSTLDAALVDGLADSWDEDGSGSDHGRR